ncbi:hypothetical protein M404DRAFT_262626 [Pisolithus tinctorius Marx 270]|uniref:Hcy-binding domain-containing protein n=1 Tax=Pisolithus tinctorius Marx 270 TaxID=870435 RepID=A0A0C3JJV8_PISTI|nr:hypothetical protein M404DRAFT_262626 [Pisolithus tinctorius Marx 270]
MIALETVSLAREVTTIRRAMTTGEEVLRNGKSVRSRGGSQETRVPAGGDNIPAKDVATTMIREEVSDKGKPPTKPNGIEINCTEVQFLLGLLEAFIQITRGEAWAAGQLECLDEMKGCSWEGIIVGGCCAATPNSVETVYAFYSLARAQMK